MATKEDLIRQALVKAEDAGLVYNGAFGADNEACTYWVVGDCIVTYLTDDEDFEATMLTEDMMDDLIIEEVNKMASIESIESLVRVEELDGRISGRLELDSVEACVEIHERDGRLTGIHASCAGLVIDGPYKQVHELLGRPIRSRMSGVVRALTVRVLGTAMGMERMETAAAAIRTFIVMDGLANRHYRTLSDALRATEGLFDASLECSQGCMLDAHQTRLLWAGWQALGADEDFDIAAGIHEGRFEYPLMCCIQPVLDDITAFIEGVR